MMRVAVVYESTRGRTKAMAEAICEGASNAGVDCDLIEAAESVNLNDYCALAVGSSTRMKRVLPMVKRFLSELKELKGLPAASFGSYGWSGEAPDEIADRLRGLGATMVGAKPLKAKDYPGEESLQACRELGRGLAEKCSS
jgi:flavodoxin I